MQFINLKDNFESEFRPKKKHVNINNFLKKHKRVQSQNQNENSTSKLMQLVHPDNVHQ